MELNGGVITSVGQRKSFFPRTNVANVDCINIVVAPLPKPDYLLVDKLIAESAAGGAKTVITVNKSDIDDGVFDYLKENYSGAVDAIFAVSSLTGEGLSELESYLKGRFCAFAGQSAVGKTSLINRIFSLEKSTGELSRKTMRGRHTTTSREIHFNGGLMVVDTPGFSAVELVGIKSEQLDKLYKEFLPYVGKCYYIGCSHTAEPDCLIKQAVAEGKIPKDRYDRYVAAYKELKENEKRRY